MPTLSTTNVNLTSFRGVISGLAFPANYYDYFEIELWDANATAFYYAHNWIDSSTVNTYSYMDFSGLANGTTYTIKGFVKPSGGSRTHVGTTTVTTTSPLPVPLAVTDLVTSPSTNSVYLSWSSAAYATTYTARIYLQGTTSEVSSQTGITGTSVALGGLSPNTNYTVEVYGANASGFGPSDFENFKTTTLVPGAVTGLVASATSDSVSLSWNAASGATGYTATIYLQGTSTLVVYTNVTGTSASFNGYLTPSTAYTVEVYATNSYGSGGSDFENFVTPSTNPVRPNNWTWTSLSSSATTYETNKLRANLVTANEWNSFTARINAFRTYKGLATISFSSASSGGDFTQNMYNQAVSAINSMATVNTTGGFHTKLVNLKNALNSIV